MTRHRPPAARTGAGLLSPRVGRVLALAGLALLAAQGCAPTIDSLPLDRYPEDGWRGAAVELVPGATVSDTLDVTAGDHTDWKSVVCDRRGTLLLRVRLHHNDNAGHLQIVSPAKSVVLNQELVAGQQAYDIELPIVHPGTWLIGLSLRGGRASYEMQALWY